MQSSKIILNVNVKDIPGKKMVLKKFLIVGYGLKVKNK